MRSDRKQREREERKRTKTKFGHVTRFWSWIFLLVAAAFAGLLVYANILPKKYLYAALGVLGVIVLILFPILFLFRVRNGKKGAAFVISLLITALLVIGGRYLVGTLSFIGNITDIGLKLDKYYVVVRDDGQYEELSDIGGTVLAYYRNGADFEGAMSQLQNKVTITPTEYDSLPVMVDALLEGDVNATFMSSSNYESTKEVREGFEDDTKILDTISIRLSISSIAKPVEVSREPFNVVISGLDFEGNFDAYTSGRSDVNMVATVNPKTHQILLTSIPRDYYVPLAMNGEYDKLTHTGVYGVDETVNTIAKLTGVEINYYMRVNFSTVVTLVDAIGGIDITPEMSFTTVDGAYSFEGGVETHVDGTQALAFARERKAFSDGDFQRNRDQQIVMAAILKKVTQSSTLLLNYTDILAAVEGNMATNLSAADIKELVRAQADEMSGWSIETQNILGVGSMEPCYSAGYAYASVVLQDADSIATATARIREVMEAE